MDLFGKTFDDEQLNYGLSHNVSPQKHMKVSKVN